MIVVIAQTSSTYEDKHSDQLRWKKSTKRANTILPTPGDPTKIILSTDETRACPVSAKLSIKHISTNNNEYSEHLR